MQKSTLLMPSSKKDFSFSDKNNKTHSKATSFTDEIFDLLSISSKKNKKPKTQNQNKIIDDDVDLTLNNESNELLSESDNENEIDLNNSLKPKIHFQIISRTTISIEFQPSSSINDKCESIMVKNGAYFQEELKLWLAPFKEYPELYKSFSEFKNKFSIKKIPQLALRAYNESFYSSLEFEVKKKTIYIDYSEDEHKKKSVDSLPTEFRSKLYSFQKEGIQFAIERHGRVLIADEMGVGKTIQAIALCKIYQDDWPVLIICPGSVKYSWKNELMNWLKIKEKYIQILNNGKTKLNLKANFYIISYDLIRRIYKKLNKRNFNFVILDESHCIKNKDALRTYYTMPIAQKSKRLLLLSGTPLLSRPVEGFTALACLRPDIFDEFNAYGNRYCDPQLSPFGISWSGASNTKELHFIFSSLMIRRLKKEVLNQLPPKRRMKIEIECEKSPLNQIKDHYKNRGKKGLGPKLTMPDIYRLTGEAKIKGVKRYVSDLIETDVKFLIFGHHQFVLDAIEKLVLKQKIGYIRIDGKTVGQDRYNLVNKYQEDPKCKVAILSINAASTGITLTSASLVVFAELTWTPAIMIQAEDRAHRIGQIGDFVDVAYLYGRDTLDEYIFSKLSHKLNIVSTTLDDRKADLGLKQKERSNKKKKSNKKENQHNNESSSDEEESQSESESESKKKTTNKKSTKSLSSESEDEDEEESESESKGTIKKGRFISKLTKESNKDIESLSTEIDIYDKNFHEFYDDLTKRRRVDNEDSEDEFEQTLNEKLSVKL